MNTVLNPAFPALVSVLMLLQCQAFIFREITVNDPVTFPCTCSGNCPVVQWTRFIPNEAVIAESRMCHGEQYDERFSVSGNTSRGNFSLTISSVAYNDAGSYRCSCNRNPVAEVKLKVIVPTVIKAFERENITLPCYGNTQHNVQDVTWKKDGQKVLLYTPANRSVTTAEASESRLMMSRKGFRDGCLSLHISSVHLSDAGLYQCLLHDESQDGDPEAVLLKVEGRQQLSTTNSNEVSVLCVFLGFIIFVSIIGLIVYVVRRCFRKSRSGV
ncbi:cell surface A33 antigen-like [Neoarius graeffei]|uniref:cell surface A33 antigen-like n=1 Tax=Neoarius graeffei TaxID=443677 RepID=UPI00298CFA8A|nr:cell surface A33 antigen-like [Neoarius graeffei]XP_060795228.1 cell surface A33 antigen-like [Neoarius graeffei]